MDNKIYLHTHPLWLLGFRPFFSLAILSGLSLPILWALMHAGVIASPKTTFSMVQWHAHEMFFGFGWAILGGFLLTATKNWVKVRGYYGYSLMFLVAAWLFDRAGMWFQGVWPPLLFEISSNLFMAAIVAMLMWTLISKLKEDDHYRDNYFLLLILPIFLLSKNLMLSADYYQIGWSMTVGLFRVAFLVMLERTLSQFMKAAFQVAILRNPVLNLVIKFLGLLLAGRFIFWKPQLAMRRLDIGIMYLGCLAIVAQLLIEFLRLTVYPEWPVSVSIHVFTFGVMGLIIPAMIIRISKGHTGRKVAFDLFDKLALWVMMPAFVLRTIAPLLLPAGYAWWIYLSASCWFICFALLAWRYIPFLVRPRIDAREH
jgi:uncharacterized protein involved in response to NO